jgi:DNA-binding response OmpR family regulator
MPSPGAPLQAILLVGEDMQLLDTRAAVLRNTGAEVECLRSAQVPESAGLQAFDLIILCHTLGEPEARTIADAAERLNHPPFILLLNSLSGPRQERSGIRFDAIAEAAPEVLVRTANELLSRRNGASRL